MIDTKVQEITNAELQKWGLAVKGWKLAFITATTYAGRCLPRKMEIQISRPISEIETDAFIIDTIKHEIAHALAGCHNQHNDIWKAWARKVGCTPRATYKESKVLASLRLSRTKYVMCFKNKIVQTYLRKPNKKVLTNIKCYWAKGHKEATLGKLAIEVYNPTVHKEFM